MLNKFKVLFFSLMLALSVVAPVANATVITGIPTLTVAGRTFTDVQNLIVLGGYSNSSNYTTMRKFNGSAGYAVTAGKTLTILAVRVVSTSTTAPNLTLAQSDNDVGITSATTLTNGSYVLGSNNGFFYGVASSGGVVEYAVNFTVAASKYLSIYNNGGGATITTVYGYEQ